MSLVPGFLQAIRDDLDQDEPRLIFADWLEDQGEPRGELMRIQCRLARWVPDLEERSQLLAREGELLEQNAGRWLGPLKDYAQASQLQRGLWYVTIDARRFLGKVFARKAMACFQDAWVGKLRLTRAGSYLNGVALAPYLGGIPFLDVSRNGLTDVELGYLLASPHLEGVTHLDLSTSRITDEGVRKLIQSPLFKRLLWLDLRNSSMTEEGAHLLLQAARQGRLRTLEVHGNDLGRAAVQDLIAWRRERQSSAATEPARVTNSLGMELARIPPGTFLMGAAADDTAQRRDELPQHAVTITRPFYLGLFQVTQRQYQEVMGTNPARFSVGRGGGPHHPVENVSWADAVRFCERLSALPEEKKAGRVYRLPTEAEWEHACRGGTTTPFAMGGLPHSTEMNYDGNHVYAGVRKGPYLKRTSIVGAYEPGPFGLFDMHGNVWEWCADWYSSTYYRGRARKDPRGPSRGTSRVIRGGCWDCIGSYCRAAHRYGDPPTTRDNFNGFRVALGV